MKQPIKKESRGCTFQVFGLGMFFVLLGALAALAEVLEWDDSTRAVWLFVRIAADIAGSRMAGGAILIGIGVGIMLMSAGLQDYLDERAAKKATTPPRQ